MELIARAPGLRLARPVAATRDTASLSFAPQGNSAEGHSRSLQRAAHREQGTRKCRTGLWQTAAVPSTQMRKAPSRGPKCPGQRQWPSIQQDRCARTTRGGRARARALLERARCPLGGFDAPGHSLAGGNRAPGPASPVPDSFTLAILGSPTFAGFQGRWTLRATPPRRGRRFPSTRADRTAPRLRLRARSALGSRFAPGLDHARAVSYGLEPGLLVPCAQGRRTANCVISARVSQASHAGGRHRSRGLRSP